MSTISSIKIGDTTYDIKDPNTYTADEIDKLIEESASSSSGSGGTSADSSDGLDIYGDTPYINFHYGSSEDITSQIIESDSGTLTVNNNMKIVGAVAEGLNTTASGIYSHAEGNEGLAFGWYSHAEGGSTLASGSYSHAEGCDTIALDYQLAIGHYNDIGQSTASTGEGTGTGTIFVIGNGTSDTASNAFRVDQNGKIYAKSSSISTGVDYAEYLEWADGNSEEEDRRGYFVTLDGKQIKIANSGDYILGVVSGNPCVIGNGDECWQGEFLRDEFDSYIYKEYTKEVENEDGTTETKTYTFYEVNPDYDPEQEYISRDQRPEWAAVGWMGQLPVRDDGTCEVNGYCIPTDGGIATACEVGTTGCYRVIERISDNIVRIILK